MNGVDDASLKARVGSGYATPPQAGTQRGEPQLATQVGGSEGKRYLDQASVPKFNSEQLQQHKRRGDSTNGLAGGRGGAGRWPKPAWGESQDTACVTPLKVLARGGIRPMGLSPTVREPVRIAPMTGLPGRGGNISGTTNITALGSSMTSSSMDSVRSAQARIVSNGRIELDVGTKHERDVPSESKNRGISEHVPDKTSIATQHGVGIFREASVAAESDENSVTSKSEIRHNQWPSDDAARRCVGRGYGNNGAPTGVLRRQERADVFAQAVMGDQRGSADVMSGEHTVGPDREGARNSSYTERGQGRESGAGKEQMHDRQERDQAGGDMERMRCDQTRWRRDTIKQVAAKLATIGDVGLERGVELGDEWKEAAAPDGRIYYYNRRTRVPRWSLPPSSIFLPDQSRPPGYRIFTLREPAPGVTEGKRGKGCYDDDLQANINSRQKLSSFDGTTTTVESRIATGSGKLSQQPCGRPSASEGRRLKPCEQGGGRAMVNVPASSDAADACDARSPRAEGQTVISAMKRQTVTSEQARGGVCDVVCAFVPPGCAQDHRSLTTDSSASAAAGANSPGSSHVLEGESLGVSSTKHECRTAAEVLKARPFPKASTTALLSDAPGRGVKRVAENTVPLKNAKLVTGAWEGAAHETYPAAENAEAKHSASSDDGNEGGAGSKSVSSTSSVAKRDQPTSATPIPKHKQEDLSSVLAKTLCATSSVLGGHHYDVDPECQAKIRVERETREGHSTHDRCIALEDVEGGGNQIEYGDGWEGLGTAGGTGGASGCSRSSSVSYLSEDERDSQPYPQVTEAPSSFCVRSSNTHLWSAQMVQDPSLNANDGSSTKLVLAGKSSVLRRESRAEQKMDIDEKEKDRANELLMVSSNGEAGRESIENPGKSAPSGQWDSPSSSSSLDEFLRRVGDMSITTGVPELAGNKLTQGSNRVDLNSCTETSEDFRSIGGLKCSPSSMRERSRLSTEDFLLSIGENSKVLGVNPSREQEHTSPQNPIPGHSFKSCKTDTKRAESCPIVEGSAETEYLPSADSRKMKKCTHTYVANRASSVGTTGNATATSFGFERTSTTEEAPIRHENPASGPMTPSAFHSATTAVDAAVPEDFCTLVSLHTAPEPAKETLSESRPSPAASQSTKPSRFESSNLLQSRCSNPLPSESCKSSRRADKTARLTLIDADSASEDKAIETMQEMDQSKSSLSTPTNQRPGRQHAPEESNQSNKHQVAATPHEQERMQHKVASLSTPSASGTAAENQSSRWKHEPHALHGMSRVYGDEEERCFKARGCLGSSGRRRALGPVQRSSDVDNENKDLSRLTTPATALTGLDPFARKDGAGEIFDEDEDTVRLTPGGSGGGDDGAGEDDLTEGGSRSLLGSSVLRHKVRRQLFGEESEAKPVVFCPFCGDGVIKSGGLAGHLEGCYVLSRCRGGATHNEVVAALEKVLHTADGMDGAQEVEQESAASMPRGASGNEALALSSPLSTGAMKESNERGVKIVPIAHLTENVSSSTTAEISAEISTAKFERCQDCGRTFAPGRLQTHAKACRSVFLERRKPYDPRAMRAKGTPLEFFQKPMESTVNKTTPGHGTAETSLSNISRRYSANSLKNPGSGRIGTKEKGARTNWNPTEGVSTGTLTTDSRGNEGFPLGNGGMQELGTGSGTIRGKKKAQTKKPLGKQLSGAVLGTTQCFFCSSEVPKSKLSVHMLKCSNLMKARADRGSPRPLHSTANARIDGPSGVMGRAAAGKVQCPHCLRGFSAAAGPVHIAICARVEHRPNAPHVLHARKMMTNVRKMSTSRTPKVDPAVVRPPFY